ncbi:hypothetical protein CJ20_218 [Escherichia phage CJ20]|uniref:Uncharacterized protein n=1 Tax=Shigella phage SP18 TaxID=645664 RepID=E3SEU6_BPSP8|nr:hypothetical protein SP18_gp141 [Shigella phage SP18]ADO19483.1 hypothetical protein SP18gp141 [Shigella phage SP18]QMP18814.1 hypothetical protein CJ20_218 [Escherichia phage CJ20]UHS65359.1 hypothetical protein [Escherichia phage P896]
MNKIEIAIPKYYDEKSAEKAIYSLLNKTSEIEKHCEEIADEYGIQFGTGDYGSGRTYYPVGYECSQWFKNEIENNGGEVENGVVTVGAWVSSSAMC